MEIGAKEIELIVREVLAGIESRGPKLSYIPAQSDNGVFERVEDAIGAAHTAQREWVEHYRVEDRRRIIEAIRMTAKSHAKTLAKLVWEETGMGRFEDKIQKHMAVIEKTPGVECLTTDAISGDEGLMIEEYAPFGVIGAITPSTNPTETIINNTISMIAGGNAVVFNVHPGAKKCCAHCLKLLHQAIVENGGPANLITMQKEPTMEAVTKMTSDPRIRLMVGTGGMPMVNALLRSGKKTIGAGAGNPPVIVDDSADVSLAAREIYRGASFDNNILCLAEKEVFVMEKAADELVNNLVKEGAYLLNPMELNEILKFAMIEKNGSCEVNKKWVGKDAGLFLEAIGVSGHKDVRLLICETDRNHPFVMVEQLMPILPIVRLRTFEECVESAVAAESGNRHTASMFSRNVENMTRFGKVIETTIFTKNGSTLKGVGIGGEGHTTMTIAGPTGEGLTCARSFTRRRRCMLAEGGLRII
ncbi:aldehyde dehydrogenase family protein [Lacrimispora saccharolytica]|uniref:Aldehyde Dehydrogenase n=1 Tax=Lacrimispora saccharolytica (strain ATCC 35040 / DSM 2544 / NRCC 2533 / WM1) TaxID=610130 RepID=D9QZF1_LACSW|nr:aldehyde dehydrogenase family protein [Lacrimispora saccharolytica]ADL04402.1 Aldehyde Dehydrogenase [[Clostridium] saccharolyticum WM1]QRV21331.1 aldehyde dehydrogenase EutE [Lacrimispora saccharolytica]